MYCSGCGREFDSDDLVENDEGDFVCNRCLQIQRNLRNKNFTVIKLKRKPKK